MKKKLTALLAVLSLIIAVIPSAYANTFVNEAFKGSYLSAGATEDNYALLDIINCTDTTISVNFRFVKNNNEQLIYECYDGTMNDTTGTVRFKVSYKDGQYVSDGTMSIQLDTWCVRLTCDSDQGQHLFDGTMIPSFTLSPYTAPAQDPVYSNPMQQSVKVMLNGSQVQFANGIEPVILDDFTYVPLRSVFDLMGINVYWDEYQKNSMLKAQTITCTKNDTILQFARTFNESGYNVWTLTKWVGEDTSSANKSDISITDVQPVIIGSSSYVPLRVVSEGFGAEVNWEGSTKTVIINCDTANTYKYDQATIGALEDYTQEIAESYITPDFTSVIPDTTPYYSVNSKFYKFDAKDQWGDVTLVIYYGQYIDVISKSAAVSDGSVLSPVNADAASTDVTNVSDTAETGAADAAETVTDTSAEN